jgi:small subunit ribosomal protein S16
MPVVIIRLRRIGKNPKKRPHFRVSVFTKERDRDSSFIEEIGFYNPTSGEIKLKQERVDYWVKQGAQLSATVKSLVKKSQKSAKKGE